MELPKNLVNTSEDEQSLAKTGYKLGATEILNNENKLNQTLKMRIRNIFNGEVAVTILTRSYLQISCSKPTHSNSKL